MAKGAYNYMCKDGGAFNCSSVKKLDVKCFKADMFTCEADSKKQQAAKDLSVAASFMCPDVSWLERNACPLLNMGPVMLISTHVVVTVSFYLMGPRGQSDTCL